MDFHYQDNPLTHFKPKRMAGLKQIARWSFSTTTKHFFFIKEVINRPFLCVTILQIEYHQQKRQLVKVCAHHNKEGFFSHLGEEVAEG